METTLSSKPRRFFHISQRYYPVLLITAVLVAAHLSFGILEGYPKLAAAIIAGIVTESILSRLVTGHWRNVASAYITGISIGILIRSPLVWPFALGSIISITSKYVLRYKGRHIWNPSNFGIVAMLLLASDSVAVLSIQWGNNIWSMIVIWALGFFIVWRVKRLHISAVYVLSFFFFAWVRTWFTGDPFFAEAAPITGPMYQLFTFFMITDPKTTVSSKKGQILVVVIIAFTEMIFRLFHAIYAPFYALFLVGPAAMIIESKLREKREPVPEASAQSQ